MVQTGFFNASSGISETAEGVGYPDVLRYATSGIEQAIQGLATITAAAPLLVAANDAAGMITITLLHHAYRIPGGGRATDS